MAHRAESNHGRHNLSDPKVFISYAQENSEFVRQLKLKLETVGIKVWVCSDEIKPGDDIVEQISQALNWCNFFILVCSEAIQNSHWAKRELRIAVLHDKVVIPCLINDSYKIPFVLAGTTHVNFQNFDDRFASLLSVLKPPSTS